MKTWKKVGLTALSASLISVSANAGALDVTGAASITFHSDQDSTEILIHTIKILLLVVVVI